MTYHGNYGGGSSRDDGQVLVHGIVGNVGQIGAVGLDDQRGSVKYQGIDYSGSNGDTGGQGILSTTVNGHGNGEELLCEGVD